MKKFPFLALPYSQGMTVEDLNTFLFEFDVLCMRYDYISDAQKLKFSLATLKGEALRWFMGLGSTTIEIWGEMKETFLSKYQDYFQNRDLREEILNMTQKEEDILEDYVEQFHYKFRDLNIFI